MTGARHRCRTPFFCRAWLFESSTFLKGLEEDHATDLEDIEAGPAGRQALAELPFAVERPSRVANAGREADVGGIEVEVEMLPAGEHVHGGRVDLLHHPDAPALNFRAGDQTERGKWIALELPVR